MSRPYLDIAHEVLELPVAELFGRLCLSLAESQRALDEHSVAMLERLAKTQVSGFGGETRSLLSFGFVPSFYQITEATVTAKVTFSVQQSSATSVSGGAQVGYSVFSANFNASYASKFSFSASGTSEITARIAAVPPPLALLEAAKNPT